MIGTKNDIYGTPAEGRGAWCLSNYVGISTKAGNGAYIGDQRPNFLKLATTEDKRNYPDFCFTDTNTFTEKSYSQIVNEGGNVNQNFYIFDLENYLSINNFTKPNAVYITMGFNDFNYANNGINVYERLKTCFNIMITMINRLSNVSIAIDALPSIAFSHIGGLKRQKEWFFECMKYIENRNEANVKFVPRCISQPSMLMYNFDKTELEENVYELSVVSDDIHPNYVGYEKGAEHFCNFVAYVVKD